jgi:HEPN domain-containing protein
VAINIAAQIQYWRDGSTDDLEAARALLDAGKIRQAGFFLHLAIEKAIKACAVAATRDLAPRSHDLLFLIERANIILADAQRDFLGRVQVYCLEGRYPTELPPAPMAEAVDYDMKQAEEIILWLMNQLNNP